MWGKRRERNFLDYLIITRKNNHKIELYCPVKTFQDPYDIVGDS